MDRDFLEKSFCNDLACEPEVVSEFLRVGLSGLRVGEVRKVFFAFDHSEKSCGLTEESL